MTQLVDPTPAPASTATDLVAAVQRVLAASPEPLTLSKIRARLPGNFKQTSLEELAEALGRQVAANVMYQYPRYRSQQDRFWDRPMPVHLAALLHEALEEKALAWPQLRRKLPPYALAQVEPVLQEQLGRGLLYRHPPISSRGGERFGVRPPDPKEFLRMELPAVFRRLAQLGFETDRIRAAALELLHDEEWSPLTSTAGEEDQSSAGPEGASASAERDRPADETDAGDPPQG